MKDRNAGAGLEISCGELRARQARGDDVVLIDCRERDEHALVHLAGARNLPMSELPGRLHELEPYQDRFLVVHCHHGVRSLQVAAWLARQGFSQVRSLAGGIDRWAEEIEPELPRY
jgi:rhodanese-related sulfurtransferase